MNIIDNAEEYHTDDLHRFNSADLEKYVNDYMAFITPGLANADKLLGELKEIGAQLEQFNVENAKATVDLVTEKVHQTHEASKTREQEFGTLKKRIHEDEQLCHDFADKAENFVSFVEVQKEKAAAVAQSQDLEEILRVLTEVNATLEDNGKEKLHHLEDLNHQINERNIIENPFAQYSLRSLKTNYDSFLASNAKRLEATKHQIESRNQTGITPEEYAEIKESFEHFDQDKDGKLNALDFYGVLKFLGENATEESAKELLTQLDTDRDGLLNMDEYKEYIISKKSDKDTAESYAHAFDTIAGGKDFVTEDDLRRAGMPGDKIDHLKSVMPHKEGLEGVVGYDYKLWLSETHH